MHLLEPFSGEGDGAVAATLSDEEVLARALSHPSLFSVILERYQAAFLRKAVQVVGDHEEARDVVQETFVKIYRYAGRFEKQEGASFSSWAYKILMNTSFTHYQKRKRTALQTTPLSPELEAVLADRGRFLDDMENADYVGVVLEQVAEPFRRVLSRYFLDGRSQQEIADEEGVSVGAVKTRMHRAKAAFRKTARNLAKGRSEC